MKPRGLVFLAVMQGSHPLPAELGRLDLELLRQAHRDWDFTPLDGPTGAITAQQALQRTLDFFGRSLADDATFSAGFGRLTAEYPARYTPGLGRERLIENRLVWIVLCDGYRVMPRGRRRLGPAEIVRARLWNVCDAFTGERLLSPGG